METLSFHFLSALLSITRRSPPNIHIPPRLIQELVRAFTHNLLPKKLRSITAAIITGRENIQHHFGYGV